MESNGTTTLEDGTVVETPPSAVSYYSGNISIPSSIVQQWGESDDIIWDYVTQTLGLVLV
jgi:hypothetical protein